MKAAPEFHLLETARMLLTSGAALSDHFSLHGQLAQVEWAEEKHRLAKMLLVTLLGFACLLCALLFAGVVLMAVVWETMYRIPAGTGLVLLYGSGVAVAWRQVRALSALRREIFATSRAELAADAALLKASL